MGSNKRGIAWWIQRAGPVERVVAATLAVIFVVGILLIADGLMSQPGLIRKSVDSAPQRVSESAHRESVRN